MSKRADTTKGIRWRGLNLGPAGAMALVIMAMLLLVIVPLALASGEQGTQGEGDHGAAGFGKDVVFQFVNFFLLIGLLVYAYRKYSGGGFERRSIEIKRAMEEAAEAKKKAEAKYLEYQARLARLDVEIEEILEASRQDADRERQAILAEATKQAAKIVEQAELTARQEVEAAKQELRREAAELAAGMAADTIRRVATLEDQRKWVQAYIEKIGDLQ